MREFRLINKIADLVAQTVNKTTNFTFFLCINYFLNHYEGKEFESATKLLASSSCIQLLLFVGGKKISENMAAGKRIIFSDTSLERFMLKSTNYTHEI